MEDLMARAFKAAHGGGGRDDREALAAIAEAWEFEDDRAGIYFLAQKLAGGIALIR